VTTVTINYEIELNEVRLDIDDKSRDNIENVRDALNKIQLILLDIDARLKVLE